MKWQCALLQRWLPDYPDGELPGLWKRWLKSHLVRCAACRQELAALNEVMAAIKAAPVTEPDPGFWNEFDRDLHLKLARLAQSGQEAPNPERKPWAARLVYLLGAPAMAALALWVITVYTGPQQSALAPQAQKAQAPALEKAAPVVAPKMAEMDRAKTAEPSKMTAAPPAAPGGSFTYVTLNGNNHEPSLVPEEDDDVDLSTSSLDSVLAGMNDQEKERFLKKLDQKKKE